MSKGVKYEFDPFELVNADPLPSRKSKEAMDDIANYVLESVLSSVGDTKSPVAGHGSFPKLNKDYKKSKDAQGGSPIANLELTGSMLSALEVKKKGDTLILQITGKEADKADGHNNHSGDSTLPLRRFIPLESETFKKDILSGISRIIESYRDDE
jgi:hypothetical protein